MNPKNPEEAPKPMFPKVATALGIPEGTSMWQWPKKPLGKAPGGKGHAKAPAKGHSKPRGHSKGMAKVKKPSYEAGFG